MKILLIGRSEPTWTPDIWLKEALEMLQNKAEIYDCRKRLMILGDGVSMESELISCVNKQHFDLIIITRGSILSSWCIRQLAEHTHLHYRYIDASPRQIQKPASLCHTVSASSPWVAEILKGVFIPDGCHPPAHFKGKFSKKYQAEVSMIGKPYDVRLRIITELKRCGRQVKTWGNHSWPDITEPVKVYADDFRSIVASSKINLATNLYNHIPGWTSIRVHILLACGGFVLINYFPGIESFFQNEKHLVWYKDEEDVTEIAKYWLSRDNECSRIAESGRQHVLEKYTMQKTAEQIIELVKKRTIQ